MEIVSCHCENGSYQIQGIYFYQYYSPLIHADNFKINITITAIHRLTSSIFDVSSELQNKNFPIH